MWENRGGIYQIINKNNGSIYIGSTIHFGNRWKSHLCYLRNNKHQNKHLQNAWNKYGENNFLFQVVEVLDKFDTIEKLTKKEKEYIDNSSTCRYNIIDPVVGTLGLSRKFYSAWNKKDIAKTFRSSYEEKISKTLRKDSSGSFTKLTWEQVREIRKLVENDENINYSTIGRMYNVDRSQISRIINKRTWVEVE